jgi:DNA recombination protein RmuC
VASVSLAVAVGLAVGGLLVFLWSRVGASAALADGDLARGLEHLLAEVGRLGRAQDIVRREVQEGRESSLRDLAQATQGIRGDLGEARRTLAEVKAIEQSRGRQIDQAADSLRRLEAVVAGSSSRGQGGESVLARALGQLPPDMLEVNVAFEGKVVEFALRLPDGRLLPIDSKWTSVASLERLADADEPAERRRLEEQVAREVRSRMRELAKYLDPERTLALAVLAVPDAAYAAAPEVNTDGYRQGVLIVPYSLALPYVLALYRLAARFGTAIDQDQLGARLRDIDLGLRRIEDELEGRLARGLVQIGNATDAVRDHVRQSQGAVRRLLRTELRAPEDVLRATEDVDPALKSG